MRAASIPHAVLHTALHQRHHVVLAGKAQRSKGLGLDLVPCPLQALRLDVLQAAAAGGFKHLLQLRPAVGLQRLDAGPGGRFRVRIMKVTRC